MGRKGGTEEVLHQPGEEPGALPAQQERTFVEDGGHGGRGHRRVVPALQTLEIPFALDTLPQLRGKIEPPPGDHTKKKSPCSLDTPLDAPLCDVPPREVTLILVAPVLHLLLQ